DLGDYPVLDRSGSRWYRLLRQAGVLVVLVSVPISIGPGSFWNRAAAATRTDVVNETRDQSVFTDVKVFELREYNFVWMGVERESDIHKMIFLHSGAKSIPIVVNIGSNVAALATGKSL